jgi:hypothetical protein
MNKTLKWWNVRLVTFLLATLMIVFGSGLVALQYRNKSNSLNRQRERMDPKATEPGLTPADYIHSPEAVKVTAGFYLDRVVSMSIKEFSWVVDGYFWIRCRDTSMILPDEFNVVDGWIESLKKEEDMVRDGERYVMYRLVAAITTPFEAARFPCDDHLLTVCIEFPALKRDQMIFLVDSNNTSISSRVRIPGYIIHRMAAVEKPHSYKTTRGNPLLPKSSKATYSQFRMGVWIKRDGWGYYFKLFLPLFVAVSVSMLAFFIKPTHSDPRFGLGIGALFAAVANSYITSSIIPITGELSLTDLINLVGTSTILLTLIESAISLYIHENRGNHELSRRYDRISFFVILSLYILLNISMAFAATI